MHKNPKDFLLGVSEVFANHAETLVKLAESAKTEANNSKTESGRKFWLEVSEKMMQESVGAVEESLRTLQKKTTIAV